MDDQSGFENAVRADDRLRRARQAYAERAWREAYEAFSFAEEESPLTAADLELLATSAYMLGREDEWLRGLERAHHLYADAGEIPRAVRCAFWVGTGLALRGEIGGATGWAGRALRLLDQEDYDCVERRYLPELVADEVTRFLSD